MDERLIESFHMMWDHFPIRTRLIRGDRTVLAVNKAAEAEKLSAGVKCYDGTPIATHAGCRANAALAGRTGLCAPSADGKRTRYWIPVAGYEDVYVHFSIPREETGGT